MKAIVTTTNVDIEKYLDKLKLVDENLIYRQKEYYAELWLKNLSDVVKLSEVLNEEIIVLGSTGINDTLYLEIYDGYRE